MGRDKRNTQHIAYPCLIVEVLSDSTVRAASAFAEAYDRGEKGVAELMYDVAIETHKQYSK